MSERGRYATEHYDIKKVQELVLKRYRTQHDFGEAIGWSDAKVSYKLKGFKTWGSDDYYTVGKALGITKSRWVEYFFTPIHQ